MTPYGLRSPDPRPTRDQLGETTDEVYTQPMGEPAFKMDPHDTAPLVQETWGDAAPSPPGTTLFGDPPAGNSCRRFLRRRLGRTSVHEPSSY